MLQGCEPWRNKEHQPGDIFALFFCAFFLRGKPGIGKSLMQTERLRRMDLDGMIQHA